MAEVKTPEIDIEAKMNELLAAAQAKAEELIKTAEEKVGEMLSTAEKRLEERAEYAPVSVSVDPEAVARMNEPVSIRLMKDNERYKDDVFVAVNGKGYQIQRGVTVEVPRFVADVLEQSMEQDARTSEMMSRLENDFLDGRNVIKSV